MKLKLLFLLLAIPFFGLAQSVTTYNRSAWTVTPSSEEVDNEGPINGRAATLIDGDTTTFWVSKYGTPFSHTLVFDMGVVQPVNQLYYVPRNSSYSTITKGSVSFGDDGTMFGPEIPIAFNTKFTTSTFTLPTVQNHRYFRLTLTANRATLENMAANDPITAMNEVGARYNTTLSATLTAFTVQATGTQVDLNWTTSLEQNSVSYAVTRSVDGLNNFTTIGTVPAAANTNATTNYTFTDNAPIAGTSFYRLELTSTTGPVQKSRLAYAEFPAVVYSSNQPKNLNVFYFIPSDLAAPADFKKRMDGIMLGLQTYYGNEMQRNGRGNKTFSMLTDAAHQKVKLIVINGKLPKSGYPREDASPILAEINEYKAANPSTFYGDHNLIMLPAYSIDYNPSPSDPDYDPDGIFTQGPFSGQGKDCFAMDYDLLNYSSLGPNAKDTRDGRNNVKFIGGLAHEIAHGLNVPHNILKVSETTALGTALMSDGNYTFGATRTSLTAADAAILNRNQVFNTNGNTVSYYGPNKASISSISACYNALKGTIIITGTVTTNGAPVTDVSIYNDPAVAFSFFPSGVGDNKDYDAVTWSTVVTNSVTVGNTTTANFYIEELISDLQIRSNSMYEMKVNLIQLDGNTNYIRYRYDFGATEPTMSYAVYTPEAGVTGPTLTPISATITASAGTNGTISPAGATVVSCASNQVYTITTDAGYVVESVLVDGVSVGTVASYTFTNVTTAHTINATFVAGTASCNCLGIMVIRK